ncbi:MAG: ribosome maturation factor RimM [bacterium]
MALIRIGKIVNSHGLKGEVKVLPSTDFKADRYASGNTLFIAATEGMKPVRVTGFRVHQGFDLLTIEGVSRIEDVELYKGLDLYAEDTIPVHLGRNEFYATEIIGMMVNQGGKPVGRVAGIRTYPQGDYLEVAKNDGAIGLVPFIDQLVPDVDRVNRVVTVVEMEGLL